MNEKLYEIYKAYRESMDAQGVSYDWTGEDLLDFFNQMLWEEIESENIRDVTKTEWLELNDEYKKRGNYKK